MSYGFDEEEAFGAASQLIGELFAPPEAYWEDRWPDTGEARLMWAVLVETVWQLGRALKPKDRDDIIEWVCDPDLGRISLEMICVRHRLSVAWVQDALLQMVVRGPD